MSKMIHILARPSPSVLQKVLAGHSTTRQLIHCGRRTFFASSTDHTRLVQDAEVHRLDDNDNPNVHQYVLVDYGMDLATVQKVPQLHLGRLSWDSSTNTISGVKVVNKTLGECQNVCGKLLEAALKDARQSSSSDIRGMASLHGLSDYVLKQPDASPSVQAIAKNEAQSTCDQVAWEKLCHDFVEKGMSSEAKMYQEHGGILSHIEHDADASDYANTCAGSIAVFRFGR